MSNQTKREDYGLSVRVINLIVEAVCENPKVKKILLFGSRAKGDFKRGSDIDLAIFADDLSFDEFIKIRARVGELPLPYTIDIVDFLNIENIDLKEHILKVGRTIYVAESN